jgi:hypothetical protein
MAMTKSRIFASAVVAAGVLGSLLGAPAASAAPKCTDTAPMTKLCETNGSAQLTTSPQAIYNNVYPYGGFGITGFGIGGIGVGW